MPKRNPPRPPPPPAGADPVGRDRLRPVAAFLRPLLLGAPRRHGRLTLWPLRRPDPTRVGGPPAPPPFLLLAEALAAGEVRVTEAGGPGGAGRLRVRSRSAAPVLVLLGELLRGARQDRAATASVLVPPHAELALDVARVDVEARDERPPARRRGGGVPPVRSESLLARALRRELARQGTAARARHGRRAADPARLREAVARRLAAEGVDAPTRSAAALRGRHAGALAVARRAFPPQPAQVGFVAAVDGVVVGLEALGRPDELAAALPALVESYALDALAPPGAVGDVARRPPVGEVGPRPDTALAPGRFESPEPFLAAVQAARGEAAPSPGAGEDWRLASRAVRAAALVVDDAVVHVAAFPVGGESHGAAGGEAHGAPGDPTRGAGDPGRYS